MYGHAYSDFSSLRGLTSLTPRLETVIAEVPTYCATVQALELRANPQGLHRAKHLPTMNWTYGDTGFCHTSNFNMKVLTFAKNENTRFLKP